MDRHRKRSRGRGLVHVLATATCSALLVAGVGLTSTPAGAQTSPVCPAAAGNARLVRYVYLNILNRCPDPTGLSGWTQMLNNGLPRATFTDSVDMSEENIVNNNVVPIFGGILNRAPTSNELAFWSFVLRNNKADDLMIAYLGSSDEAYSHVPGADPQAKDAAWLIGAYNNILDRDPDPEGAQYFSAILGNPSTFASRFNVAFNYLERSDENARDWVGAVYFVTLNRPPDPAGADAWFTWLRTTHMTFRMYTYFLASDEAYALAQTQPNPPPPGAGAGAKSALAAAKRAHSG